MIELTAVKKNKITLSDYNYRRDIENRLLLASFTAFEIAVLEEILYSPIKAPIRKIAKNIEKLSFLVFIIFKLRFALSSENSRKY